MVALRHSLLLFAAFSSCASAATRNERHSSQRGRYERRQLEQRSSAGQTETARTATESAAALSPSPSSVTVVSPSQVSSQSSVSVASSAADVENSARPSPTRPDQPTPVALADDSVIVITAATIGANAQTTATQYTAPVPTTAAMQNIAIPPASSGSSLSSSTSWHVVLQAAAPSGGFAGANVAGLSPVPSQAVAASGAAVTNGKASAANPPTPAATDSGSQPQMYNNCTCDAIGCWVDDGSPDGLTVDASQCSHPMNDGAADEPIDKLQSHHDPHSFQSTASVDDSTLVTLPPLPVSPSGRHSLTLETTWPWQPSDGPFASVAEPSQRTSSPSPPETKKTVSLSSKPPATTPASLYPTAGLTSSTADATLKQPLPPPGGPSSPASTAGAPYANTTTAGGASALPPGITAAPSVTGTPYKGGNYTWNVNGTYYIIDAGGTVYYMGGGANATTTDKAQPFLTLAFFNATWATADATNIPHCDTTTRAPMVTVTSIVYTTTSTYRGDPAHFTPPPPPPPQDLITPPPPRPTKFPSRMPFGLTTFNATSNWCFAQTAEASKNGSSTNYKMGATVVHCWASGAETMISKTTTCYLQTPEFSRLGGPEIPASTETTVLVTAKVPTVVLPPQTTPDYGGAGGSVSGVSGAGGASPGPSYIDHVTATGPPAPMSTPYYPQQAGGGSGDGNGNGNGNGNDNNAAKASSSPVAIAFAPGAVIIDGQTFSDTPGSGGSGPAGVQQVIVTVGVNVFTISPSQVIGMGTTLERPGSGGGGSQGVYAATPTSAVLDGLAVTVSGASVIIDGTAFALPAQPSMAIVHGDHTMYVGPDGVAVPGSGQTLHVSPVVATAVPGAGGPGGSGAPLSEVIVAGGHLITVAGKSQVVLDGRTLAYGGGMAPTVTTVAGELVTLGPQGVVVRGTTLGGPHAAAADTQYELVGGATLTEVAPSVLILNGRSYTLGPTPTQGGGNPNAIPLPVTTVVGGETVTIGPSGVTVGTSLTFPYPFAPPTITLTPPGAQHATNGGSGGPSQTMGPDGRPAAAPTSKNAASSALPPSFGAFFSSLVATSILFLLA